MAGAVSHTQGNASARVRRLIAIAIGAAVLGLLLPGGSSWEPPAAQAQVGCPGLPSGLSPASSGPQRFTMMIRINTQGNVDTYTKPEGGMGGRIRPQDVFVLNTRFTGSGQFPAMTADVATQLAAELRASFPCNRIIALTGMSFDPAAAGYAFSGVGDPNVFALLTDYEQMDYNQGRATDPSRPPWRTNFNKAFPMLRGWNSGFSSTVAGNPIGAGKRTGLAPQDVADWNYGQIAQNLNKHNARLGDRKLGPMSIQTQDACADGGSAGFGSRAKQLRLHYTFKFVTRKVMRRIHGKLKKVRRTFRMPIKKQGKPPLSNTAMQISFTDTPQASKSQAILSTSAAQAAACVGPAMKQGVGAFFFFASDDSMRMLFQQPQINALRPATAGSANTGGVGSPK
ncbi:MAG TPA: hypothetical protein VFN72_02260 [Solirubrobacterales bacterium]|nr:hypothetical protein [Solirubrobacterales bacterium]